MKIFSGRNFSTLQKFQHSNSSKCSKGEERGKGEIHHTHTQHDTFSSFPSFLLNHAGRQAGKQAGKRNVEGWERPTVVFGMK